MSEMKHTKGPWSVSEHGDYSDYDGRCIVILGDDDTIKVCAVIGDDDEETNATASLIAAAPDLLNALSVLADAAEARDIPVDAARAATAKAQGHAHD